MLYKHYTGHISKQCRTKSTPSNSTKWRCWRLQLRQPKCHN